MAQVWALRMPPRPKAVLVSLASEADDKGGLFWPPSIASLCVRTCLSSREVGNAIRWLERARVLRIHEKVRVLIDPEAAAAMHAPRLSRSRRRRVNLGR